MFHPLRPGRERTAIPHLRRLAELHTHFNLVLSSPPQVQTPSPQIIFFYFSSKTLDRSENADFYGLEKIKTYAPE